MPCPAALRCPWAHCISPDQAVEAELRFPGWCVRGSDARPWLGTGPGACLSRVLSSKCWMLPVSPPNEGDSMTLTVYPDGSSRFDLIERILRHHSKLLLNSQNSEYLDQGLRNCLSQNTPFSECDVSILSEGEKRLCASDRAALSDLRYRRPCAVKAVACCHLPVLGVEIPRARPGWPVATDPSTRPHSAPAVSALWRLFPGVPFPLCLLQILTMAFTLTLPLLWQPQGVFRSLLKDDAVTGSGQDWAQTLLLPPILRPTIRQCLSTSMIFVTLVVLKGRRGNRIIDSHGGDR